MRAFRGGLFLVILGACGGSHHGGTTPKAASEFKPGAKVLITDGGQIYDALNTTNCLHWPSADVKKRAGRDAWKDFVPNSGTTGTVVAALGHCDGKTEVVLVAVGDYVVPVTSKGVSLGDGTMVEGVEGGVVGGTYGGDPYGGYYDDPYGYGGYGYGYGGLGYGTVGSGYSTYYAGDSVQIADTSYVYEDMNTKDCLTWPSDDIKQKGGKSEWNGYAPAVGDTGYILSVTYDCTSSVEVDIVQMDHAGEIVPVAAAGLTYANYGGGYP